MMDANLLDRRPLAARFRLGSRVDQGARRRELHGPKQVAAENLERTVDVVETDAEEDPHGQIEHFGEQPAMKRIVSLHPHACDDVEFADKWRQKREISDVELA